MKGKTKEIYAIGIRLPYLNGYQVEEINSIRDLYRLSKKELEKGIIILNNEIPRIPGSQPTESAAKEAFCHIKDLNLPEPILLNESKIRDLLEVLKKYKEREINEIYNEAKKIIKRNL